MPAEKLPVHAVILAGGRGTRFWPRSRTKTPKQLLKIIGDQTMLQQTVARLLPVIPAANIWTVTNREQTPAVKKPLPAPARKRVVTEPVGRNTAAAIALAAFHVQRAAKGDALLAVLPADQVIRQPDVYRKNLRAALAIAKKPGAMVVMGIPPTRPETGFGYVERMGEALQQDAVPYFAVRRFTEKPELALAKEYVASGLYQWNAGMFFWRVSTFLSALERHLPATYSSLKHLSASIGKHSYATALNRAYPRLENISVDYAILEREMKSADRPGVFVVPADMGWSDIGSWAAVYEELAPRPGSNVFVSGTTGLTLDADDNLFDVPGKIVAAIGVKGLVLVETPDALLLCPKDRAQDVGKIVKSLEERKLKRLL